MNPTQAWTTISLYLVIKTTLFEASQCFDYSVIFLNSDMNFVQKQLFIWKYFLVESKRQFVSISGNGKCDHYLDSYFLLFAFKLTLYQYFLQSSLRAYQNVMAVWSAFTV